MNPAAIEIRNLDPAKVARENSPLLGEFFRLRGSPEAALKYIEALSTILKFYNDRVSRSIKDPRPKELKSEAVLQGRLNRSGINQVRRVLRAQAGNLKSGEDYWGNVLEKIAGRLDTFGFPASKEMGKQVDYALKIGRRFGVVLAESYLKDLAETLDSFAKKYDLPEVPLLSAADHYKELLPELRKLSDFYKGLESNDIARGMIAFIAGLPEDYSIAPAAKIKLLDGVEDHLQESGVAIQKLALEAGKVGLPMLVYLLEDSTDSSIERLQKVSATSDRKETKASRLERALTLEVDNKYGTYHHLADNDMQVILQAYLDRGEGKFSEIVEQLYKKDPQVLDKIHSLFSKDQQIELLNMLAEAKKDFFVFTKHALTLADKAVDRDSFMQWLRNNNREGADLINSLPHSRADLVEKLTAKDPSIVLTPNSEIDEEGLILFGYKEEIRDWLRRSGFKSRETQEVNGLRLSAVALFCKHIDRATGDAEWGMKFQEYLRSNYSDYLVVIEERKSSRLEALEVEISSVGAEAL